MNRNILSSLYPNLNSGGFSSLGPAALRGRTPAPSINTIIERQRSLSRPGEHAAPLSPPAPASPIRERSASTKRVRIEVPPKPDPEPEPEPEAVPEETRPPDGRKGKASNKPKPKPKPKRVREKPLPKKGEKGCQPTYSETQRREMFLDALSRKSVGKAQAQVDQINNKLDEFDGQREKIVKREKELKSELKLINLAKYFSGGNDIENVTDKHKPPPHSQSSQPDGDLSPKSEGSQMSE